MAQLNPANGRRASSINAMAHRGSYSVTSIFSDKLCLSLVELSHRILSYLLSSRIPEMPLIRVLIEKPLVVAPLGAQQLDDLSDIYWQSILCIICCVGHHTVY